MSEGELITLRRDLRGLSEKADRQHEANQDSARQDREAFRLAIQTQQQVFSDAMNTQRNAFQEALARQFAAHSELDKTVDRHNTFIANIIGSGGPNEGRLGVLEASMETMKKFRWQALAILGLLMSVLEALRHGR